MTKSTRSSRHVCDAKRRRKANRPPSRFAIIDDRFRDRLLDRLGNEARQRMDPLHQCTGIKRLQEIAIELGDATDIPQNRLSAASARRGHWSSHAAATVGRAADREWSETSDERASPIPAGRAPRLPAPLGNPFPHRRGETGLRSLKHRRRQSLRAVSEVLLVRRRRRRNRWPEAIEHSSHQRKAPALPSRGPCSTNRYRAATGCACTSRIPKPRPAHDTGHACCAQRADAIVEGLEGRKPLQPLVQPTFIQQCIKLVFEMQRTSQQIGTGNITCMR